MNFHVGQRVVCVKDTWTSPMTYLVPHLPRKGSIYHVRDKLPHGGLYIRLVEIVNPIPPVFCMEPGFHIRFFRPVIERKTDIEIFTKMLAPKQLEPVTTQRSLRNDHYL